MIAVHRRRSLPPLFLMAAVLVRNDAAAQQEESTRGWSVYPSAQIGMVYNDNLFFSRDESGESAVYGRFGGTLDLRHLGARSSFRGGYGLTGELFSGGLEDLSTFPASQHARMDVSSQLGSENTLSAGASYILSRDPGQVFDPLLIELGRRRAEGYSANAGFERRLSANQGLVVQYGFGFQQLDAQSSDPDSRFESVSHSVSLAWNQTFSIRTVGTLQYSFSMFRNEGRTGLLGFDQPLQSHAVVYGWNRKVSPRARLSFNAGPNFYQDIELDAEHDSLLGTVWKVTPQASASYNYSWQKTSFGLGYGRRQNQFLGASGQVITDSLSLSIGVNPSRRLSLGFNTGAQRNSQAGETFETYSAGVNGRLEIARWWSLNGNYGYAFQERMFGFPGENVDLDGVGRSRNQAYVGIVIGKTIPLE